MTIEGKPPVDAARCPSCGSRRTVQAAATPLCPSCLLAMALDVADAPDDADHADDLPPYEIVTILAQDADAVTYLARGFVSSEHMALKIFDVPDVGAIMSRVHEWKTRLANARHPGISRMVDAGAAGLGRAYLATEYVAGSSLDYLLRHRTLSPDERIDIARQLADALAAMHALGLPHMRLNASRVKVATSGGVRVTILGLGASLIVAGTPPQPALDVAALADLCRLLGIPLRPQPSATMASVCAALKDSVA